MGDRFDDYIENDPKLRRDKQTPRFLQPDFQEQVKKKRKVRLEKQHDKMVLARQAGSIKRRINEFENGTKEINDKQRLAIELLLDWQNNWPMEFIADQCQVSTGTLHRWKNTPKFLEALDKEITKRRTYVRRDAFMKFFAAVKRGDRWAIRDYLKMTGDFNPMNQAEEKDEVGTVNIDQEIKRLSDDLGLDISITDVTGDGDSEEDSA